MVIPDTVPRARAPLAAGLAAGATAAVAADLLSLALRSPDDAVLNSASVGSAALVLGLIAGAAYKLLGRGRTGTLAFAGLWVVGALVGSGVAVFGESVLQGMVAYALPLTISCFALTGGVTYVLSPVLVGRGWISVLAVVAAVGASVSLAGRHQPSGATLALPTVVVPATAAPTEMIAEVATVVPQPKKPTRTPGAYASVNFVIGQGSKVTFTVHEQLARMPLPNDAVVSATALSGEVHLDGRPSTITLDLQRMSSDQPGRDKFIRTNMFPNDRTATLTVSDVQPLPEGGQPPPRLGGKVTGSLALRGGTYPLSFDWEGRDDGDAVYLLGRTTFTWKDVGMEPPSSASIISTADEVALEVVLAARPR